MAGDGDVERNQERSWTKGVKGLETVGQALGKTMREEIIVFKLAGRGLDFGPSARMKTVDGVGAE